MHFCTDGVSRTFRKVRYKLQGFAPEGRVNSGLRKGTIVMFRSTKSVSFLALATAGGLMSVNAFAADLGGECCADLEERVAELEATTARKGTRKTSLEIWGQVNKLIVSWNDSINRNTIFGTDSTIQSTRFGFRGKANVNSEISAGYSLVVEVASGARSSIINQFRDKIAVTGVSNNATFAGQFGVNDAAITMRESIWWIESKSAGRLSVGRTDNEGPLGLIDVGGIALTAASKSMSYVGGGLAFRTNQASVNPNALGSGNFTNYTLANTGDNGADFSPRVNGVFYRTPTVGGFSIGASYGGTVSDDGLCLNAACTQPATYGPIWGANLKYAGEFSGVRLVASIGHEDQSNSNQGGQVAANGTSIRPHIISNGATFAAIHNESGLFVQGQYNEMTRGHDLYTAAGGPSAYATTPSDTAKQYLVQGGVAKNWFGLGRTSLYGEYSKTRNGFNTFGLTGAGATLVNGVRTDNSIGVAYNGDNTTLKMWGLGVSQEIDAAAMQIFAGYRNNSLTSDNCSAAGGCKDIGIFMAGSKIKF